VCGTKRSRSLKPFVPHLALAPNPRYVTCTRRYAQLHSGQIGQMEDELYLEIKDGPDIIKIEPLRWTHSSAEIDWDKNWIHSRIIFKAGAFHGQFNCDLMTTDFELFKRELKTVYDK
jgi:hypothetical protein